MAFIRSEYPENWEEIALRVKERAGWRCECEGECGVDHGKAGGGRCAQRHGEVSPSNPKFRTVLTTAHLDHDKGDDETRLRAMCNGCHLRYDIDYHVAKASATRARKQAEGTEPLFGAKAL